MYISQCITLLPPSVYNYNGYYDTNLQRSVYYYIIFCFAHKTHPPTVGLPASTSSTSMESVKIPDRFSTSTMEALKTGNITRSVRIEITAAVAFQVCSYFNLLYQYSCNITIFSDYQTCMVTYLNIWYISQLFAYSDHPTGDEYNTVCRKLVSKYPVLKDTIGTEYVSSYVGVCMHLQLNSLV